MLFTAEQVEGIRSGQITVTFRRWKRPQAKAGRFQRTAAGMIKIDSVDMVSPLEVPAEDAIRAGFRSRQELLDWLSGEDSVYRVTFHREGTDERATLQQALPNAEELADIERRLRRMDVNSPRGPWTLDTLDLIARRPGVRAGDLAVQTGLEKDLFKRDVRRLKQLGLTISLEVGYRLSPRGTAVLDYLTSRRTASAQPVGPAQTSA